MMNAKELTKKFLEFENNSHVLDYRYQYRDMLMWPFIRCVIWDAIIQSSNGKVQGLINHSTQSMGKVKILSYKWFQLFKLKKNPIFCQGHNDIIFLYSAVGNVQDNEGMYYNRVYDDFVVLHDSTMIIENASLFRHYYPKKYESFESDSLDIICLLNEKMSRLNKADKDKINMFINYLKNDLPFEIKEIHWRRIRIELERYAKNNKLIYQYYSKCFSNISPKLVFVSQGCDGNHEACKIKVLKDLGIPCAEIQHGFVDLSHFAYNYSNIIYESKEYQEYMPDVFLTMGRYWMERVRLPIKMDVLGSANFYKNRQKVINEGQSEGILVLPVDTQSYLDLVTFLGENLPDKKIIVKIHPLNRRQYEEFSKIKASNTKVYIEGNIYDYLKQVNVIIGDNSTVLYEAYAIKKTVMVWRNERSIAYTDPKLGYWFDDKHELLRLLQEGTPVKDKDMIAPEDIFEYDMKTKYMDFINLYLKSGI